MQSVKTWLEGRLITAVVAALVAGAITLTATSLFSGQDAITRERAARTKAFCAYAHQQQVDKRDDAIEGYRQLPQFARFFKGDPADLQHAAFQNLERDLHVKYGNGRIPPYCPQQDWPEKLPPDLQNTG